MDMNGSPMDMESLGQCLSSFVDDGTVESHRYYLSRRTVLEMLRDRGYAVPMAEIDISLQDFRDKYGQRPDIDRLKITALHKYDPDNKILAIFCGPSVIKVNIIRGILTQIVNKETLNRLILIVQSQLTNQAMKAVELFSCKVEIFQVKDLLVNITKHVLKPKHQVLSDEEKQQLLQKYSLEEKQLPRMSQKDAIARYFGLEKGQVVKVTYTGEIIETHVTYRCVW
ncbi:DNA-directed RNA polymerase V subunit 5A [Ipomoea triloba]|uniref:DNA-directed RNA polymerase V subunit 5A n=1 Tax=Ipomoea triloba TaxID=35885 RepID=UPI00125DFC91|nr:DNA-directed RNA polymerase V subunit 5A [Ipomoea triloba]GMC86796.1 DNA-directed RNA polymerase V subunit 5A [Ipomoea batatas]GMD39863.1 DNA-directed RNA polymerase V subunit 5A [Ipomoea batatas]